MGLSTVTRTRKIIAAETPESAQDVTEQQHAQRPRFVLPILTLIYLRKEPRTKAIWQKAHRYSMPAYACFFVEIRQPNL